MTYRYALLFAFMLSKGYYTLEYCIRFMLHGVPNQNWEVTYSKVPFTIPHFPVNSNTLVSLGLRGGEIERTRWIFYTKQN
jgi:hypothetical protein